MFDKHVSQGPPVGSGAKPGPLTHFCCIRAQETHLVIAITCLVTAF